MINDFSSLESEVKCYCRSFPNEFERAKYSKLFAKDGREYIDFFSGAGVMNYGHNNSKVQNALIDYLKADGIVHSLDMTTVSKRKFIETFYNYILAPRGMDYKFVFTSPSGAAAVEAAILLARKITNRHNIIAFSGSYHGLTSGALGLTSNPFYKNGCKSTDRGVNFFPYDGYLGEGVDTFPFLEKMIVGLGSGIEKPAAIILETIQGEGGVNVSKEKWLQKIQRLCNEHEILLIIDDIQVGNGRTGPFFSFERANLSPDIIVLSKAIGGGLPMAINLIKPALDQWKPCEHTGTFRGNNLAFVAGTAVLENYWKDDQLKTLVREHSQLIDSILNKICHTYPEYVTEYRGLGMIWGLQFRNANLARFITRIAFNQGLLLETCGVNRDTVKIMPSLVIEHDLLAEGMALLFSVIEEVKRKTDALASDSIKEIRLTAYDTQNT